MTRYSHRHYITSDIPAEIMLFLIFGAIIMGISFACTHVNEKTQTHKILSIDKVEQTHGDSEGFSTEVYYLVTTDKGAYHISTSGFNAAPGCAGIKKDSTYILTTRGVNFPFLGMYPNIISVRNK